MYTSICTCNSINLEFQVRASRPERQRCHLSTAEAEYAANLLTLYGTDYKVHVPNYIRQLII